MLQFLISDLFYTQGLPPRVNTIWLSIHLQLGHLKRGYSWVHLKHEVMMFIINKREQIWDEMVIHVNKSSLSYQEICKHYIEATDSTPVADRTGDFIIVGARLFLRLPILIVKPMYVDKPCNNVTSEIHEFKCTKEDKSIDQSKYAIILVYNSLQLLCSNLTTCSQGSVL